MSYLPIVHISAFFFYLWSITFILNRKPVTKTKVLASGLFFMFYLWSVSYSLMQFPLTRGRSASG